MKITLNKVAIAVSATLCIVGVTTLIHANQPSTKWTVYTVKKSGESLWDIANQIAPHRDPRDVVYQIAEKNNLGNDVIQLNDSLLVPDEGGGK